MLKITFLEAKLFKSARVETEHVLLSMLKDSDNLATRTLNKFNVDYEQGRTKWTPSWPGGKPTPARRNPKPNRQRRG